jgi:hypothetical protein
MRDSRSRGARVLETPRRRVWLLRLALGTPLLGCVLDPDDRCGPYQTFSDDDEICVCEAGAAYTPTGCVPCAENEVVTSTGCGCAMGLARASASEACAPCAEHEVTSPNGCICEAGFSRAAAGEACAELESGGAGSACSSDAECLNPSYPHCQLRSTGTGYCTNEGCADNAACAPGFTCVASASPSACLLPPEGAGRPCTGPADCAGTEALFCDTFVSQSCLVMDCSLDPDSCFPGMECCNVGIGVPNICIPAGACTT